MSPFPLFRLPRVVLCDVFKSLSIEEKIKLSLCSKKVSIQINNARLYSQKVIVVLNCLSYKIRVHSENIKDTFDIFNCYNGGTFNNPYIHQYQIEGHTVPVISFSEGITIFWKNYREGYLSVIRYLLKIFQCKFSIGNNYDSDLYKTTSSELFHRQVEFKTLAIRPNGSKDENLLWNQIASNLGLVEDLRIISVDKPDVTPVFTSWPQKINIGSAAWFTLESLLACPCTSIFLEGSHFENKDLEVILRKWKTGGFPNLEYLYVNSQGITNNRTTILGMSLLELVGKVIQTDDGLKMATIDTGHCRIEMSVISPPLFKSRWYEDADFGRRSFAKSVEWSVKNFESHSFF
ncbi:hypothetical protein CRE_24290 [Caenorhabditis remanei]|uniref:F-box domain-containing protein n=1 Tax=Caenorhabditis remanei TaxID=31234 RepID=E3NLB8_CAERE|nr:hypothetical protein CRE_24290 [Caenorhabditis remanei]